LTIKHKTITTAAADKFTVKSGRVDHFDTSHPGLALRVSDTGRKAWVFFYRLVNGKVQQRRQTLGLYPTMSVAEAHEAWRKARDLVQAGRDPMAVTDNLPAKNFRSVFEEWIKRDYAGNKTKRVVERRFERLILPSWEGRLITDIDRRAALAIIDDIADSGRGTLARRVFAHLHRLFVWCVGRDIIAVNPLQHAEKPGEEVSRSRVLTDAELLKVWQAAEKLSPAYRDAFKLLVLTGARKQEISALKGEEIKDNEIVLEGERTKNGEPHHIPLSTAAKSVLGERGNNYCFSTLHGTCIRNWHKAKEQIDRHSGVTGWVIHDLRRTVATGLQRLGVQLPVTEAVLGHTGGSRSGIVKVYQRHNYAGEKRAALEAWGAHVTALVEGGKRGVATSRRSSPASRRTR
jgi:integrase